MQAHKTITSRSLPFSTPPFHAHLTPPPAIVPRCPAILHTHHLFSPPSPPVQNIGLCFSLCLECPVLAPYMTAASSFSISVKILPLSKVCLSILCRQPLLFSETAFFCSPLASSHFECMGEGWNGSPVSFLSSRPY